MFAENPPRTLADISLSQLAYEIPENVEFKNDECVEVFDAMFDHLIVGTDYFADSEVVPPYPTFFCREPATKCT